jgi:UDP-2-acetamido-2,6-beta-L-arabino-hexul-4-ose reductase
VTTVGITGASGFIGKNLIVALERRKLHEIRRIDRNAPLAEQLRGTDVLVHLAGVNRVAADAEFVQGNIDYLREVCAALEATETNPCVILASSIHAETATTPYGRSKRAAEEVLADFVQRSSGGAKKRSAIVYRLPNVFGKWGRPHYNSVVATFAHAIARGEPYEVHEPEKRLRLVYVDDVVAEFMRRCDSPPSDGPLSFAEVAPVHEIGLGELARTFESFAANRRTNHVPSFDDPLTRKLFATFTANLDPTNIVYALTERSDARGRLAEIIKSEHAGQIFVSVTRPGAFRGNHFHDTKVEKFLVLQGSAAVDFEDMSTHATFRVTTSGDRWEVIDIPPGASHRIVNLGSDDLIVLFWACEVFDPERPDTYPAQVTIPNA